MKKNIRFSHFRVVDELSCHRLEGTDTVEYGPLFTLKCSSNGNIKYKNIKDENRTL